MQTENKYKYSNAYHKILNLIKSNPDEDVFVIRGGQGAGKTVSILELVIQSLLVSEKEASVLSGELSKMKRTVIRDYKKICKDWGVFENEADFNRSECKHEYPNDSYLDFLGADVADVGKGFRRDILYINEADKMPIDTAVQFISRAGLTIIDYNPDKLFWGDDYINENNFITLTFEDNEYLSNSERKSILDYKNKGFHNTELTIEQGLFNDSNIKSKYWSNKWKVYGLGLVGSIEGVVFEDWKVVDFPSDARLLYFGCDFGFATSKLAIIGVYSYNDSIYLKEFIYENKLTNQQGANLFKQKGYYSGIVFCDSAEPKSIQELRDAGIDAKPCGAKQDIKSFAIQKLNEKTFFVDKDSLNLINELNQYVYDEKTSAPKKSNLDHLMDALLYAVGTQNKYDGRY